MLIIDAQLFASKIFIANNSFEQPVLTGWPGYNIVKGSVEGWTFAGAADQGFFNPTLYPSQLGIIPNGSQVAYSNGGTISQTLSATLRADTKYTLTAYVGRRTNVYNFPGYNIQLYAGGNLLASNNSVTPALGTFKKVTVDYTSGVSVTPGQALEIRLTSNGPQVNFDNVTLDILTSSPP